MEEQISNINSNSNKKKIIVFWTLVFLILSVYLLFLKKEKVNTTNVNIDANSNATTTQNTSSSQNNKGYVIELVEGPKAPSLNRPLTLYPGAKITPEAKAYAETKISQTQAALKKDIYDWTSWMNLGMYQKQGGDYDGALISWKFASTIAPNDSTSLANIGNLYAYFIKDNGQAEVYYKNAISKTPTIGYLYAQLAEVYRDVFNDLDKAKAIINEGLSKIPNDPGLLEFKNSLK